MLGCRALKLTPDKPAVFSGDCVTFVAAQLDPALHAPPGADEPDPIPTLITPERRPTVKPETSRLFWMPISAVVFWSMARAILRTTDTFSGACPSRSR